MKQFPRFCFLIVCTTSMLLSSGCRNDASDVAKTDSKTANCVQYAHGLKLFRYKDFTLATVQDPWPGATKSYRYVLVKKDAVIPDSLKSETIITVPVRKIIVTSTTHIPSLEMLGSENTLIGFPQLDYISSPKVRRRIADGKVRELGTNQSINVENVIDLSPDVFIGYGIDNNNQTLDNLKKAGIKVMLNGDWNEQTALGKAEWIKLFGALYDKDKLADSLFDNIVTEYENTIKLAKKAKSKPTVMAGALYENKWYMPYGDSWGATLISQAGGNYLWADSKGTGSLSLSFETVLDKASGADFWIGPGQFTSLSQLISENPDYGAFKSYKQKNVFSFSVKKGETGGVLYYELAPNRPDLVLKDLVSILHPELLPNYKPVFFEKLK
ncbi:ABC transporter substrate-binding protein [Flavobacterium silvaticum]|uniref:ABC transporter substrate-binding protein n=1 Tax=Flavobacterium silvaticum TaxID=1852020 RepID=A0A972JGF0_9FLAO|nr:ABC transporter substrate-binding protein [Flavobacterium silvaticum]NMH28136.1 ABC transporter substrate-binding protein [Flavobacterium silvaticum]